MWLVLVLPVAAQSLTPGPPGPYVVDVRGATTGLPQHASFFPPLPPGTVIPGRGFGFDAGAHVYVVRLGSARVGIGANLVRVRGTASPQAPVAGARVPSRGTPPPDTVATLTIVAPQISFNFGTAEGWSYVSAGIGAAQTTTTATGTSAAQTTTTATGASQPATRESGSMRSLNAGAGARWFLASHVAVGFDLRLHRVAAGRTLGTPGVMLFAASAGLSIR